MQSTYRLNGNELNEQFMNGLKETFKNKEIEIVIYEVEDDTEYLLKSEANKEHLLNAIENVNNRKHLETIDIDELQWKK